MTELHPNSIEAYNLLHQGTLALSRAEQVGIRVDLREAEKTKKRLSLRIKKAEAEFFETKLYRHWAHIVSRPNIMSGTQLASFLYKTKKLQPAYTTTSGVGATDEEALRFLEIPELESLIKIKKMRKVRDTYLESFLREQSDGVIHPSFNLHLVKTFRSSSDKPNFQNIPKRDKMAMKMCRKVLFPRVGHQICEIDYSGIEVRVAACYHKDPTMLKYITDPTTDMHGDMAVQLYMLNKLDRSIPGHTLLRNATKNSFVFPQFYGSYYGNCAKSLACTWGGLPQGKWKPTHGVEIEENVLLGAYLISKGLKSYDSYVEHVRKVEDDFWNTRFPVYQRWKDAHWERYLRDGYVDLLTGFRCNGVMAYNDAINYPIQGAAFHVLLKALVLIDAYIQEKGLKTRIIGQIHDAIILDIYPPERDTLLPIVKEIMNIKVLQHFPWINVPLEVEADIAPVDGSWADVEPIKIN